MSGMLALGGKDQDRKIRACLLRPTEEDDNRVEVAATERKEMTEYQKIRARAGQSEQQWAQTG